MHSISTYHTPHLRKAKLPSNEKVGTFHQRLALAALPTRSWYQSLCRPLWSQRPLCTLCAVCTVCTVRCVLQSNSKPRPNDHWVTVLTPILPTALARDERGEEDDDEFHREHTSYLSFFLHMQNFWRRKFKPKFTQKIANLHSKLPIYTVNCQFFALNL